MDQPSGWSVALPPAPDKSSELYIHDHPFRSIAIVSSSHALILRYSTAASESGQDGSHASLHAAKHRSGGDSATAKCMVEFSPITNQLLKNYRPLASRPVYGTLGLIAVNGDVFLSIITRAERTATLRPGETVERILSVAFHCLSSAEYDDVVPLDVAEPAFPDTANSPYGQGLGRRDVLIEHPCHDLQKLLSNGSFYYSTDFDVTNRLQDRPMNSNSFDIDNFDDTYLWNSFMISPLVQFRSRLMAQEREALDSSRILTSAIRGFCKTMTLPQSASPIRDSKSGMPSFLTLISRLSCRRAGTRFNSRGIDDDGNVANFVESETIFWSSTGTLFSYAQVRGSVPVFWEQAADLLPGRQKITVTRSQEGAQPAFDKHFEDLEHIYGAVHIINLLSATKPAEVELSTMYRNGIRASPLSRPGADGSSDHALLQETHYDFHAETKGPAGYEAAKDIRRYIHGSTDGFAYFLAEETSDGTVAGGENSGARVVVVLQQEGVFRTNCLDCLDRTNLIQTIISQMAVDEFLGHRGDYAASDFWMRHSSLWADNGDSLSKIYAGTGALKSSFTRHGKMSLSGAMADMRKSVQRIYHNNFVDPSRQMTIDMLLGRLIGQTPVHLFDPISDFVSVELGKRSDEFSSFETISIWTGTFNLNGRADGIDHDLSPWLFPPSAGPEKADVYVVAFQEIVELSPQQIMNSDPSKKYLWEQAVQQTLNEGREGVGGDRYVLLRSGQLVGAALCVFVKSSILANIKNVEGSVKKTGLSGMAGNKGAVAIRFDYANTHICFVTAHLAAGFANYDERNRDYATIHQGLRFQRNRGIEDHDAIVWLGDFNYRIGLGLEKAKGLIKKRDLASLYENDQLNLQMVAGLAFPFYSEAHIAFMPTYKFDIGTDNYDSSEKARIPAWTDRILRKGVNIRQLTYDSAPLRFSDHRPVYATFECRVSIVNEALRERISHELYERRKAEVGDATAHVGDGEDTEDEDLIGYDAIEPGLPPASSDRQKWWLDNKQPARAQVSIPSGGDGQAVVLNPQRPSNPFGHGDEADWITIPRPAADASLSSMSSSPYEKVSLPQSTAKAQVALGGISSRAYEQRSRPEARARAGPPAPPPPRRQGAPSRPVTTGDGAWEAADEGELGESATSSTRHLSRRPVSGGGGGKPAPPVARKPAHLATSPPPARWEAGTTSDKAQGGDFHARLPQRSPTTTTTSGQPTTAASLLDAARGPAALPERRMGTAASVVVGQERQLARTGTAADASASWNGSSTGRRGEGSSRGDGPVDLLDLGTDGGEEMCGWQSLQPSTKSPSR
ncbi:SacI domain and endonuclease/exonuclease/phosphatase [Drechmeria coniospora]|uniref:phosphoinositide 5-phosphatase n=1 Tax=Drechmeria coniospora TaxID=98403 RepID=A0A151GE97_DRECN|nr:SacI domain and endonuclease/exonuclease/phosphatase [Drechmeria coniospora]KYK55391.1 SacI domain and endonuclease/exonuclease/phosphatase [Drechmeria coniospora]